MWKSEIDEVKHVLSWWQRVRANDGAWISSFLEVASGDDGKCLIHKLPGSANFGELIVASPGSNPQTLVSFSKGWFAATGWDVLSALLSQRIGEQGLATRVLSVRDPSKTSSAPKRFERPILRQVLSARNLVHAIWLQLTQAIVGDKRYGQCKQCMKFFELTTGSDGKRADFKFCGTACRSRAYRHRIVEASQLRESGQSTKEIAAHLGTKTNTVRKWTRKKGRRNMDSK